LVNLGLLGQGGEGRTGNFPGSIALSSTIVGTSNTDHLASNVAIAEKGPLPAEVYEQAKQAFAA
jgi:aryl-alcohol dehydrogenase-like predicted oxidoreductase